MLMAMDGVRKAKLWEGKQHTLYDELEPYIKCGEVVYFEPDGLVSCESVTRLVEFQGLRAGKVRVEVKDLICSVCGHVKIFDGRTEGVFFLNSTTVYSRELLDLCMYQVCGLGASFRESHEVLHNIWMSVSLQYGRAELPDKSRRRQSSTCFMEFFSLLHFPSESVLSSLFSCSTCEKPYAGNTKRLDGVVMDGTAVGILKRLPLFQRPTQIVPKAERYTKPQYLFRQSKMTHLADRLFMVGSGRVTLENGTPFEVQPYVP